MGRSCKETAKDLAACCKMNYGNVTVKECATGDAYLKAEDECTAMRAAYYKEKAEQVLVSGGPTAGERRRRG